MTSILKSLLKKVFLLLFFLLIISFVFIYLNKLLIKKLSLTIEERNNLLKTINQNLQKQLLNTKINSKIKEIEAKYKIDFSQFKNSLISEHNLSSQEIQNKIINIAQSKNLNLKAEEINGNVLKFSLTGNFNELKLLEEIMKENRIRARLESIRIFPQAGNYLFKIEILTF